MEEPQVLYTREDGIGIITLNRPDQLNAIRDETIVLLNEILAEVSADNEVRAVIITGNGRAFCAGTDVTIGITRTMNGGDPPSSRYPPTKTKPPATTLPNWQFTQIPKPTIAAVNGAAVGVGVEWTVQCDIRIASEKARFGWVFPLRGVTPDTGAGPYLLPYIVGMSNAMELLYSGEIIDAQRALEIGLVSAVVPPGELMTAAKKMAAKLTRGAPMALKSIKELAYGSMEWPPSAHHPETVKRFNQAGQSEDAKEGVASFLEKRPPVWKGR